MPEHYLDPDAELDPELDPELGPDWPYSPPPAESTAPEEPEAPYVPDPRARLFLKWEAGEDLTQGEWSYLTALGYQDIAHAQTAAATVSRESTAREGRLNREAEAAWRADYNKFLYAQLAATQASQAADRELRREALRAEIAMNEKRLAELKASNKAQERLAYGKQTGYYFGGPLRGAG